jgi:hypothetical protein
MDDLDRLAFRVVRTVRTTYPHLLEHGFTLADLEEKLAPYLETRRELAVGGPNGYEHTVLRFLSGERGYLGAEIELQEACRRALQMPSPAVSIVRTWARSPLVLRSGAFALVSSGAADAVGTPPSATAATTSASPAHGTVAASACGCHFCGGRLPSAREARFCPHCGLDLTMRQCPACSTELERHWRFCVTCGRQADDETAPDAGPATPSASTPASELAAATEPLVAAGLFA